MSFGASSPLLPQPVNFRPVNTDLKIFRGGQPNTLAEWEFVYNLGCRMVIKLNLESEAQDSTWLTFSGTELFYCPITAWQQLVTEPELATLMGALDILGAPGFMPTFIHCEHGINRTGLLCALYRVQQGWTVETALQEWHGYGAIPIEQEGLEKAFADLTTRCS